MQNLVSLTNNVYKIDENFGIPGYCFLIFDKINVELILNDIFKLIEFFLKENVPHNIFFTLGSFNGKDVLRIYIFPRENLHEVKDTNFNIAFCELSGYVPVGSLYFYYTPFDSNKFLSIFPGDEIYDKLTEEFILDKIQENIGNVYKKFDEIISQLL